MSGRKTCKGSITSSLTWTAQMNTPTGQCSFQSDILRIDAVCLIARYAE